MIKLSNILKEINEDQIDISALNNLDDEIKKALENAPKNEIIGTVAIVLAIPGIINSITKIIEVIAKKAGIQLKKQDPKWYQIIGKVTEKIDDYIDTPIKYILKPFIKDQIKREKIAKIIKAVVLTMMAIYGSIDVKQIESTISLIKKLAPEISQELIQSIIEKNPNKIATILKPLFN
jgi:tetrahydromethanopterin S-methyltransferase subunit H